MTAARFRLLLIGASGMFGRRIAGALARDPAFALVLAGRNRLAVDALAAELQSAGARALLESAFIDVDGPDLADTVSGTAPELVIHTAGPFQRRDYRVAKAAMGCGAHYVDLADGREFVAGIDQLDPEAVRAGCWVISGASSVPALTAAVVEALQSHFGRLDAVEAAISPGNRTPRGLATTQAILGYVGKRIPLLRDGRMTCAHGWQSLRRLRVEGLSDRWVALCDVPDLTVLPARYPGLQTCEFRAGLELRRMHFGLWLASWAVRLGMLRSLSPWATELLRISERWLAGGSDVGVMQVALSGLGVDRRPLQLRWQIVASNGSGPQIPATAAVVLAKKLSRGEMPGGGACACLDRFTLEEFLGELADQPMKTSLAEFSG